MNSICLFLSEEAYNGLVTQARNALFIRGERRSRGLSTFMATLLVVNPKPDMWLDNRPQSVKDAALEELESGQFPTWDNLSRRHPRNLGLSPRFKVVSAELAKQLGVIKSNAPGLKGRGDRLTTQALTSQLWEAIGIGWLTPATMPTGPSFKSPPRKGKEELVW